ncbi:Ku protein [Streptomyces sp. NPDC005507]|uniref:Ku protein n=1 Tax=Streptomyces sp. NPDC005507 TaxID=3154885 RepID=UPI0033ADDF7C
MVAIPVQLYAATEEHSVPLHEIHTADGSRVQHRRFCAVEGREIPCLRHHLRRPVHRRTPLTKTD